MAELARFNDTEGTAALGICESLLLALTDLKIISEKDARDLLTDVATTHQEAAASSLSPEKHQAVIKIVQRILAGTTCGTRLPQQPKVDPMGICSLTGNLQSLSISFRRGEMTFHGPLNDVDFYANDEEQPSKCPGFLDVFSEKCGSMEARLREDVALGRIERSHAEQLAGLKSCAMIMACSENGVLSYSFSLMLPQREFEAFARVGERHMGDDVVFLMSFPYPGFADGREQRPPTSAEFYVGTPLIATDMDIDLTFRPVRVVRLDSKNVVRLQSKK